MTTESPQVESTVETAELKCVVGIGASAGGLKPIETLFANLANTDGMAFVVVQHLSPGFKSAMVEILGRHTNLPVIKSEHGMAVEPGHVYLITPKKNLTIENGRFVVEEMISGEIPKPIDRLFESLGSNYGVRSAAIVLSGTGSDGAEGIKKIQDDGGLTIVQEPNSAQFNGMPNSSIATECVDAILEPEEIAQFLNEHSKDPTSRESLLSLPKTENYSGLELVFSLISDRHGINFANYKTTTVARRLERRLRATEQKSVEDYADMLLSEPAEVDTLFNDLLIGVTKFFRDADAFLVLQSHLNMMVANLPENEELRIWCAGCATGEEAYTLGMQAIEAFERKSRTPRLKILATDLHQPSLDIASRGEYGQEAISLVTDKRKSRFFSPINSEWFRVHQDLRRHIVFARHDVVDNPPFSRMHIVTCRNLLIYLQSKAQEQVIGAFHFALEPNGIMMLGASETLGNWSNEFEVVHENWRLFKKHRNRASKPNSWNTARSITTIPRRLVNSLNHDRPNELSFTGLLSAYDELLSGFIECGILLGSNRRIIHAFGDVENYLTSKEGGESGNFLAKLPHDARITIGGALSRVTKEPTKRVTLRRVAFGESGDAPFADVRIRAFSPTGDDASYWLVEMLNANSDSPEPEREVTITHKDSAYNDIVAELAYTRESLSATIEELESSNEELMATNEELIAANEELQSTNQELFSVNEEHHSVNVEYQRKVTELEELSQELDAFLSSSEIGTIFLDNELKIRRYTEAIRNYFDLMPHDIGRSIKNFAHRLDFPDFHQTIMDVVESEVSVSVTVHVNDDAAPVLLRVAPCTNMNGVTGVVVNIVAQLPVRKRVSNSGFIGVWEWPDVKQDNMWWSPTCFKLLGYSEDELPAKMSSWKGLVHPEDQAKFQNSGTSQCLFVQYGSMSLRMMCKDESYAHFDFRGFVDFGENGEPQSISGTCSRSEL